MNLNRSLNSTLSESLNETPRANRVHIGFFGRTNSGKSTLINRLTGHRTAIVSPVAGTTADPVYKSMEINGLGACVLIDTAGFDDQDARGELGTLRIEKTREAMEKTDIALLLFTAAGRADHFAAESEWLAELRKRKTPVLFLLNQTDLLDDQEQAQLKTAISRTIHTDPSSNCDILSISGETGLGMEQLRSHLLRLLPEDFQADSITGHLVTPGDLVLLVMPQDIQAPKGRLILPQVQTIRDLLDQSCTTVCSTADRMEDALAALHRAPDLIICDSQVFPLVYEKKPAESSLTSFSILFAAYKGDLNVFRNGAEAIDDLTETSRVLIAEACTHAPLSEDIGREKLPRLLRKKIGTRLSVDVVSGTDFPEDLSPYDLIIHCGACMFNRKYVLSRIARAESQQIPITNYGVALAKLSGILSKISF